MREGPSPEPYWCCFQKGRGVGGISLWVITVIFLKETAPDWCTQTGVWLEGGIPKGLPRVHGRENEGCDV